MSADMDAFMAALANLSPMQYRTMALRMYAGMPEAQIADALGITRNTVKQHTFRARQKLAVALGRDPRVIPRDTEARLLAQVRKADGEGCWLWTGTTDSCGYGRFKVAGTSTSAHRWAYLRWVGPIPDDLELDHLCRNRACVNPSHLEPVTHKENMLRGDGFASANARKTHCSKGHEYTPENTYLWRGSRHCRTCNRIYNAQRRKRQTPGAAA